MATLQDIKQAMAWFNSKTPEEKRKIKEKSGPGADKITAYWLTLQPPKA